MMSLPGYDAWKLASPPEAVETPHTIEVSVTFHLALTRDLPPEDAMGSATDYVEDILIGEMKASLTARGVSVYSGGALEPAEIVDTESLIVDVRPVRS